MGFDVTALAADTVLNLAPGPPEGVANGKQRIGEALVERRQAVDGDFDAAGQRKMNVDLEQAAGAVAPVRCLHNDMAGGHAAVKALKGVDVLHDLASERLAGRGALETHSHWCAHGNPRSIVEAWKDFAAGALSEIKAALPAFV